MKDTRLLTRHGDNLSSGYMAKDYGNFREEVSNHKAQSDLEAYTSPPDSRYAGRVVMQWIRISKTAQDCTIKAGCCGKVGKTKPKAP